MIQTSVLVKGRQVRFLCGTANKASRFVGVLFFTLFIFYPFNFFSSSITKFFPSLFPLSLVTIENKGWEAVGENFLYISVDLFKRKIATHNEDFKPLLVTI